MPARSGISRDSLRRSGTSNNGGTGTVNVTAPVTGDGSIGNPLDVDLATPALPGLGPNLADLSGAVWVDQGGGAGQVARRLTQDDIDPAFAITSFVRSGFSSAAKELGDTIVNPAFTATYNAALASLAITNSQGPNTDGIALAAALAFGYNNGGGSTLPARTFTRTAINATVSWTLAAVKAPTGPTAQWILSNSWQPRAYYDITTVPGAYNAAFITALASQRLQPGAANSYVFGAGAPTKKIYLCWPTAFGNPASIKDQNGFVFPMTKVATAVAVTNAFAVVVAGGYDVWESDNFITSTFTLTVT